MISQIFSINMKKLMQMKQLSQFATAAPKKAAIVLAGSGVYDGSELTEAVSLFISLSKHKVDFQCYAPNKQQAHVINHLTGEPSKTQTRNVMVESARVARGKVKDLKDLKAENYDFLFFPGGFGAAQNLSDFAFKGADLTVDADVQKSIQSFHSLGKPIGAACISPIILAKVLGPQKVDLTLGMKTGNKWPYQDSIGAAEKCGATMSESSVDEVTVDKKNKIATTPAFMYDGSFFEIFAGIESLVKSTIKLSKKEKKSAPKQSEKK